MPTYEPRCLLLTMAAQHHAVTYLVPPAFGINCGGEKPITQRDITKIAKSLYINSMLGLEDILKKNLRISFSIPFYL